MGCANSSTKVNDDAMEFSQSSELATDFKPIHSAIRWNKSIEDVKAVLKLKGSADIADPGNGNCPIHIAAQNGHANIVALLIKLKGQLLLIINNII